MPHLWTLFMPLLVYVTQAEYGIEHPFAYMDDQYGIDLSGHLVSFAMPDSSKHKIPTQQAMIASLWLELKIPFKLTVAKAPFGRVVLITGIEVDLDRFSVSLPRPAVDHLLHEIDSFLDHPLQCPALTRWHHLAGWVCWDLNVALQAWLFLTPLYEKMGRKKHKNAGVFINLNVRSFTPCPSIEHARPVVPVIWRDIWAFRDQLAQDGLEPKTRRDYTHMLQYWVSFSVAASVPFLPTSDSLSAFVT
ncbi:hypothetical protein JCM1840_000398 [Sporobolomyces johnsonii]